MVTAITAVLRLEQHRELRAHREQLRVDAGGLRNEYLDPVAVVRKDKHQLVHGAAVFDDFGCWSELGIAEASLPEEIGQDRNATFPLNRLEGVASSTTSM